MQITETYWRNFRNLKPRRLFWCSGLNLLTGKNGAGKTNILEALNMACGWGSFYNAKGSELRAWGNEDMSARENVEISCEASGEERILSEISVSSVPLNARISVKINKERASFSELRAHIPALCFLPGNMNIIDGNPGVRRLFIDKLCVMLSIPYAKHLSDYKRLVRHRVKLLRAGKSPDITSELISSIGSWIWSVRYSAIRMLDECVSSGSYGVISPYPLKIRLKPGGMPECDETCLKAPRIMKDKFAEMLEFYSERERKAKIPFVGPHRDDILISVCGKRGNSGEICPAGVLSRGQKRRAVISLIIASGRAMELKLKRKPLFFLDEIFSELDNDAGQTVADALFNTGWQIFATAAEAEKMSSIQDRYGKIYNVNGGDIEV